MPMIVAKIDTLTNMRNNLRITLHKAGIPEYSYKDRREGFEVWHAERREGETLIIWHTFDPDDDQAAQQAGLQECAAVLQAHYWIKLDMPGGLYTSGNRPTLRVLLRLVWL